MPRIFISYSRADNLFVKELVPLMYTMYDPDNIWIDQQIYGGIKWWEMILNKIAECDLFIYLISNDSLTSPYCQAEFREALRLCKLFLPVIVRPKTIYPGSIANDLKNILLETQYVNLSNGFADSRAMTDFYASISKLLKMIPAVTPMPLSPEPIIQPVVPDKPKSRSKAIWTVLILVIAILLIIESVTYRNFELGGNKEGAEKDQGTETSQEPSDILTLVVATRIPIQAVSTGSDLPELSENLLENLDMLQRATFLTSHYQCLTINAIYDHITARRNQSGTSYAQYGDVLTGHTSPLTVIVNHFCREQTSNDVELPEQYESDNDRLTGLLNSILN
jgi:hypothetical protein